MVYLQPRGDALMAEMPKAPAVKAAKTKSSMNWPMLIACVACVLFIVGVWINAYRVSHAAASPAPISSTK
jgi:hypothetical protein